jgi:hypothetical protein
MYVCNEIATQPDGNDTSSRHTKLDYKLCAARTSIFIPAHLGAVGEHFFIAVDKRAAMRH